MNPQLIVFYDGLCPICSREVEHYRRRAVPGTIQFLDMTESEFDAAGFGMDLEQAHRVLHVRVGAEMKKGVDAILALWQAIPRYRWLARLGRVPVFRACLAVGYSVFAAVRPGLLRRKLADCPSDTCNVRES